MARNDLIFQGSQLTLQQVRQRFKTEFAQVTFRAKARNQQPMCTWIDSAL
jgi:hypothetical protein